MKPFRNLLLIWSLLISLSIHSSLHSQKDSSGADNVFLVEEGFELAETYRASYEYDSALAITNELLSELDSISDALLMAEVLLLRGKLQLSMLGPRDRPMYDFLRSLSLFKALDHEIGQSHCNLQLGVLNYDVQNYESAINYLEKVPGFDIQDPHQVAISQYLLALCFSEVGNYSKAEEMFKLSFNAFSEVDSSFLFQIETFWGKMYANKGDVDEAIKRYKSVLDRYDTHINPTNYSPVYAFLSTAYLRNNDIKRALYYGKIAYKGSDGEGSQTIYWREAVNNLHRAYSRNGQPDSAYFFLNKLSALKDSITSSQIVSRITDLGKQHEFEQALLVKKAEQDVKDKMAAQELRQQKLLKDLLIGGFFLALLIALLFFNQKKKLSREKNKSDSLLLNILPTDVAEELKQTGRSEARSFEQVSVLFTDFKEFTQASEKLSAKELVGEVNHCFEAFDNICSEYNIEKIKTIGDAYMSAGGLSLNDQDSAIHTVMAALEMQQFITSRRSESDAGNKLAFEMRVGIHTGNVVAGIVGIKKFQYDIWGDTVNTANRMEGACEVGRVNISATTYHLVKEHFSCSYRGKIQVKGKGEIDMYYVDEIL